MVDKELIENWRNMVKLPISSLLFKTNYEGMGEQDKEEFERDFDEILDLALIGLKHKAQLSQEGTTKGTTTDTISRQAAIDALWKALYEYEDKTEKQFQESEDLDIGDWIEHRIFVQNMSDIDRKTIMELPSAQPEQRWIPCSDENPKADGRYLITGKMGTVYSLDFEDGNGRWYGGIKPVAWMPLPEPWRGGQG